jgi:hypothetical protein
MEQHRTTWMIQREVPSRRWGHLSCVRYCACGTVFTVFFLIFSCMSQSAWTWSKYSDDKSVKRPLASVAGHSPDVRLTTAEDHKTVKQVNETTGDRGGAGTTAFASRRTIGYSPG